MASKLTNGGALFLLTLAAGVFWGTWFALTRSIETFSPAEFIHIGKTIIANVAWPMRILMPSCILLMILSAWLYPEKKSPGFSFNVAACFLFVVALLITLLVEVPIDSQIKMWTTNTIPPDWETIRQRWQSFHTARTLVSLASVGSLTVAILFQKENRPMKFMILVKADRNSEAGVLPDEKLLAEMGKYNEELAKAGIMLAAEGLHPTSEGARVEFAGGKCIETSGPFPESKDLIAGFWIWQVQSKDEAIEWVKRAPFEEGAEIEIRRVHEAADFGDAFTPELREQEERVSAQMTANAKR